MPQLLNYILLLVSLCLGVTKNIVSKAGGKAFSGISGLMTANLVTAVLALTVYSALGIGFTHIGEPKFVLFALFYGLVTLGSQSLYILAVKDGSVSVCSLIYASCFIIPTCFSAFYYSESFSVPKVVGIILMLVSILAVSYKSGGMGGSRKQIVFALLAMICAGSVGILQKLFGNTYGTDNTNEFLFLSFLIMLAASLTLKLFARLINKEKTGGNKNGRIDCIFMLALAVSVVFANKMNIYLANIIPGIIFFPVINGGTIMASALLSRLIFKEKLSIIAKAGIILGLFAMVLIAI